MSMAAPDQAPLRAPLAPAADLHGAPLAIAGVRSAVAFLAVSLYILAVGPVAILAAALLRRGGHIYTLAHGGIWLGLALAGVRCRVSGKENLVRGRAAVYFANHESNVDPPILFRTLHPRLHILFKAELGRLPLLGQAMRQAGFIPVDRRSRDQALPAIDRAIDALQRGSSFLIFPEGTRSRTGEVLPFKKGGFIMAIEAQAPVVPVAIRGGRDAMQKGSAVIRPVTVRITVGEPIETAGLTLDDRDSVIAETRSRILAMLASP